jgi:alpha-beta hydrolase superfamily lysophospholipase
LGNVAEQIDAANATGHAPVVFIHGLWLLEGSWDRWAELFEQAGYAPVAPGWPDDPETVDEANANPEVFAHKTIGQVADHFADVIGKLDKKPAVIGHSFGGLLSAGRTVASYTFQLIVVIARARSRFPRAIAAVSSSCPVACWKRRLNSSWRLLPTSSTTCGSAYPCTSEPFTACAPTRA